MKKTSQLLVKMSPDLRASFQSHCARHGRTVSELVRHLMKAEMREARIVRMLNHPIVNGRYGPAAEITGTDGKLYHVQIIPCRSQTSIQITDPSDEMGTIQLPSEQGGSSLLDRVIEVKRLRMGYTGIPSDLRRIET